MNRFTVFLQIFQRIAAQRVGGLLIGGFRQMFRLDAGRRIPDPFGTS